MKWYALAAAVGMTVGFGGGAAWDYTTGIGEDLAHQIYRKVYPVIEATYTVESKSEDGWTLTMRSVKKEDCALVEVQAFDVSPGGTLSRLVFARADGKAPSGMAPGKFRSAVYLLTPPPKHALKLSFVHSCNGRTVRTPIEPE